MSTILQRLHAMGLTLPKPAAPVANYVSCRRHGGVVIVSGQICLGPDGRLGVEHTGKLGQTVSVERGVEAARLCALNVIAQVGRMVGDLDRPDLTCLRLGGFINAAPDFAGVATVMNGASDLIVELMGEKGRHARSTVGVAVLPLDAAVEVEATFGIE
ncbi:RidA family protein [Methylobacterium oryzae]|uniref:RidA family protein n=1 Tax=Methylobacterium oryzae TaxID=334852 RepID=UPI001F29441E|nr:RidA family protein [Methylobacterium oryzae]UIN36906.1 RidA family protein [Methylobacterium oryzae]